MNRIIDLEESSARLKVLEPESRINAHRYEVRVAGPGDVYHFNDELLALRHANEINKKYLRIFETYPQHDVFSLAAVWPTPYCDIKP